jgi:hypothetical protein
MRRGPTAIFALLALATVARAALLEVGAGKQFDAIDKALAAAKKGDEVVVFARADGKAYERTAVLVRAPGITIRGNLKDGYVKIDGTGFDYSGAGRVPRAIFQFDKGADGCVLEGFELAGAHNESHNGAGVRINAANDVTVRRCVIRGNDMGIMSNGEVKAGTGAGQLIERCVIEKNGSEKEPGFNHNLYLGGTSVTVRGCEIAFSLTGHNLKSRAHLNWIEYNYIHDSANREIDLVDAAGNTDVPGSDAVLLGNIITKKPSMAGNKTVIHFGRDGKANRDGTIWLVHNSITTPYISPVLDLSTPKAAAVFLNDRITKLGNGKGALVEFHGGAAASASSGAGNVFVGSFGNLAGVKAGPPMPWEKLELPWAAFGKRPESLLEFAPDMSKGLPAAATFEAGAGTAPSK